MNTISIYLHWPFCLSKCPYCDFFSLVRDEWGELDYARIEACYLEELSFYKKILGERTLCSLFLGGGTPSLMPTSLVQTIIEKAIELFPPEITPEITLEANPSTVDTSAFQGFYEAGINRLSLGVQSFQEDSLRFLKRSHSVADAIEAISQAQSIFNRVSFDLIYATPNQSLEAWKEDLDRALSFNTEHLSLYQLTLEKGTLFFEQAKRGDFRMIDEEAACLFYETTGTILQERGLLAYEVSNYAKKGCESLHNRRYWTYEDYIGIGPGACGCFRDTTRKNHHKNVKNFKRWCDDPIGPLTKKSTLLTESEEMREQLMMGLRLKEGVDLAHLPLDFEKTISAPRVETLMAHGFIEKDTHIKVTNRGRLVLNSVLYFLLE